MNVMSNPSKPPRKLAVMGGSYGNLAALKSCLDDASRINADVKAFIGDSIGCCAHSNEVVSMIRDGFDFFVAGNHEQQAVLGSKSCGCGYSSADDEKISCEAFELATAGLNTESREWLGTWPGEKIVDLEGGRVLLCHGSPGYTSEFLYEAELDNLRLEAWLDRFGVRGFICTHSGLPFIRHLADGRFAVNCGVVGKPDHDGDTAVHYAVIHLTGNGDAAIEIRRVPYDYEGWARTMEAAGIDPIFVEPVRTGIWTTGVASLPASERFRWLRGKSAAEKHQVNWKPEFLKASAWQQTLKQFRDLGLVSEEEAQETLSLLDPGFPFFAAMRMADTVHLHVKVNEVDDLPFSTILDLGSEIENERPGYVKFRFPGGLNLICSSIPIAEEDQLPDARPPKPFVDHFGIDLRREMGIVRALFEDTPTVARRAGWPCKSQGGLGRAVFCCHSSVAEKYWVYPPPEGSRWTRPLEFAYGPLAISLEMNGCDLRPIDPRHPSASEIAACVPAAH
jgi:diadenosine tetraphosphatase ApaH/serine/threonine PP2A family protein phosphatase